MKNILENKNYKLLQGDCLELMKDIPDKSIDMILCDLPYGTTRAKWDEIIPFDKLWNCYLRIIKDNGAIVLFGSEPFSSKLRMSNLSIYKYDWTWKKPNGTGFLNAKKQPIRIIENICVFYKKQPTYNPQMRDGKPYVWNSKRGQSESYNKHDEINNKIDNKGDRFPINVLEFKQERGLHPNQKPVALLEYLIKTYTQDGEVILDNCMGSGSTGVAALNLHRKFIGMELDEKYFQIAEKRIQDIV